MWELISVQVVFLGFTRQTTPEATSLVAGRVNREIYRPWQIFCSFFYTVQSQPRFCSVGQRMAQFRAKAMYVFCSQIYRNGAGNGIYGGGKLRGRGRADRDNKHSTLLFSYKLPLFCRLNRLGSTHFHQSRVFTQIYTVTPKFISFFFFLLQKSDRRKVKFNCTSDLSD